MEKGYIVKRASAATAARLLKNGHFSPYRSGGRLYLLPVGFGRHTAYVVGEVK